MVYKTVSELDLLQVIDQEILKDEIIQLASPKAIEKGVSDIYDCLIT